VEEVLIAEIEVLVLDFPERAKEKHKKDLTEKKTYLPIET
jgi:hypothetical protein